MNNPWDVLAKITASDSKLDKQALIEVEANAKNNDFFRGIRLAYDPMVTFGVKKVEEKPEARPSEAPAKGLKPEVFFELCRQLAARELTGDAAKVAIGHARNQATKEEWDGWYRLVLLKDLKAGFGESTVNKVCAKKFPGYTIPLFECQLAKDCADDDSLLVGKKLVDTKLNGLRCLSFVYPGGVVEQYSRNGKEFFNFGVIKEQLAKTAKFFTEPMVLDAEVMSASFQDLLKQARRKSNVQADDSVLNIFDMVPLAEFKAGKGTVRQVERSAALLQWYKTFEDHIPNVNVIGQELVDLDTSAGQKRLKEINDKALAGKYEGIMLKDPEAVYECTRSYNWLKMKPWIEETLTVIGVEEGKAGGKFVGMMGALVMAGAVDDKKVVTNVGGGYTIQQRARFWAIHTGKPVEWKKKEKTGWVTHTEVPDGTVIVGMLAEVRADMLTLADGSDTWSMRFPRFRTFRGFAPGEKL